MSNQIEVFQNEQFGAVRTAMRNGELWFIGKDVCSALGYANSRKALNDHVAKEDKYQGEEVAVQDSMGREQRPIAINESGVYSLIFRSDSPKAKEFKNWMLDEVFPVIRKREQEEKKSDNQIQIFKHEQFGEIRTVTIDNEPWFVGRDVAVALGYGNGKSLNNAVSKHVDDEDKGVTEMMTPRRETESYYHQRIRHLLSRPLQQAGECKKIQALGHVRGAANDSEAWCVHDTGSTGTSSIYTGFSIESRQAIED